MALFTDGAISSIEDMSGHDTQLINVAIVEGIDVTRKLALAQDEVRIEVEGLLNRLNTSPAIEQVVVTPAVRLWHLFRALELVYRDAYSSQLNDRYAAKRDEYHAMAAWAYDQVVRGGLGIAADPVMQAETPRLATTSGGLDDGTYFAAVTWMNAAGEEGGLSAPAMITLSGSSFEVQTTAPSKVKGWNIYCGMSSTGMTMQNHTALDPGQAWVQPDRLNTSGRPMGNGQAPNYHVSVPRTIQRG